MFDVLIVYSDWLATSANTLKDEASLPFAIGSNSEGYNVVYGYFLNTCQLENGDISSNIAFLLSKELKQNPMDIANKLKNILNKSALFQTVEVASPGFINFRCL